MTAGQRELMYVFVFVFVLFSFHSTNNMIVLRDSIQRKGQGPQDRESTGEGQQDCQDRVGSRPVDHWTR